MRHVRRDDPYLIWRARQPFERNKETVSERRMRREQADFRNAFRAGCLDRPAFNRRLRSGSRRSPAFRLIERVLCSARGAYKDWLLQKQEADARGPAGPNHGARGQRPARSHQPLVNIRGIARCKAMPGPQRRGPMRSPHGAASRRVSKRLPLRRRPRYSKTMAGAVRRLP